LRTVLKLEPGFPQGSEGTAPVAPAGSEPFPAPEFLEAAEAAALAGMMQPLIDALPEQIALLDNQGTIVAANRAWRKIVREHGHEEASLGRNYRDFCVISAATGYQPAVEALAALDDLASGRRKFWQLVYNGGERWSHHDFRICFHRIVGGDRPLILVTRFDLTEVLALRRLKREFGISLTKTQALERERLARELHDSTAQSLAAAGLLVGRFRHDTPNEEILEAVDELQQLLGEAQQEIRLIAYLAHPPALEKMGLVGALESLLEGFGRRTGLDTEFEIFGDPIPVSAAAELALYRIAQEALANVHRHARAKRIRLLLCFGKRATHLVIADDGVGIPPGTLADPGSAGVGLASMRARLSEIGGRLGLRRLSPGTAILASVRDARRGPGDQ